jgi:hypothetical protein
MHWGVRVSAILFALLVTTACSSVYAQGRRNYPNYPNYPDYPSSRGGVYRGGGNQDPAYMRGFDDGYRRGLEASRDGDRYDVRRDGWYRSADRGYDRRYGSRNQWRQSYRDGFTSGYDRGYREARYQDDRYRNDRYRRRR